MLTGFVGVEGVDARLRALSVPVEVRLFVAAQMALAVAEEREACARVAEAEAWGTYQTQAWARHIAEGIRARGS